jgi:peptidoglycan/LPS O-acetylase OafA/YrhL
MGYQERELQSDAARQPIPKIYNQRYVLGYNARLDGLRGWATLCVLFYHYFVPGFQAGIYGLDVFFVISGYLITKVLVKFIADEQSLGQFYWNRFLRLMPALAEICAVLVIISLLFPKLADPQSLQRDAVSSILYVANWTRAFSLGFSAPSPFIDAMMGLPQPR